MQRATKRELRRIRYGRVFAHGVEHDEAIDLIVARAKSGLGGFVLTPNVDHIALARREPAMSEAYENCFLSLADGMPLVAICRLLRLPLHHKVSGSDLLVPLLERCADDGLPIFFFGGSWEVCDRAQRMLKERYPHIEITGHDSSDFDSHGNLQNAIDALHRARASGARIIICSLPPAKQVLLDQLMWEYAPAVGVATGGALSFFVGDVKRAPRWVSKCGLEWLYRLIQEPSRLWHRYLVEDLGALPAFMAMVLRRMTGRALTERDRELEALLPLIDADLDPDVREVFTTTHDGLSYEEIEAIAN
ncbi:MAG TPA: WecB/TagA/CpsF family glycosyltransferase, partial [Myxococcaceae bacterium]|jgi:N-acetylglucosaminyldiphosphoundecaprenol N-acetyl-beta-D-mannosaminyltransferase